MTIEQKRNLKSRNLAVLLVLVALIAIIFAITVVRIGSVGPQAVATPETPYGRPSGQGADTETSTETGENVSQ